MSYAPSFRAPGGHIFDVVSQILKKHVFTAQNSQHVASELRMCLWTSRSQTDRNTPSEWKIDLGQSRYNGFFCYNASQHSPKIRLILRRHKLLYDK